MTSQMGFFINGVGGNSASRGGLSLAYDGTLQRQAICDSS
jgi:hypothetical protein